MHRYLRRPVQGNLMKCLPPMSLACKTVEQYQGWELGIDYPGVGVGGLFPFYQLYTQSIVWVLATSYNLTMCFGSCKNRWNQDTQRCPQLEALLYHPPQHTPLFSVPTWQPLAALHLHHFLSLRSYAVCIFFYAVSLIFFAHTIDTSALLSSLWVVRTWLLQFYIFI